MKHRHLLAILVTLALAIASCGGDEAKDTSTQVTGTSTAEQTEQPPSETQSDSQGETADRGSSRNSKNGDGGSTAADAERAATSEQTSASKPPATPTKGDSGSTRKKRKSQKNQTPEERVASLSPSERRKLHKDLYDQGVKLCAAYGPKELAKSFNLTGNDPQTIAQQFARQYEAATPTLILPYQQCCLVGFKKFARKN